MKAMNKRAEELFGDVGGGCYNIGYDDGCNTDDGGFTGA